MLSRFCLALVVIVFSSSSLLGQSRTKDGAVLGGVAGAIIGGIAGHQNDETPEGIAIGGAVGAIAGGLLGNAQDKQMIRDYEQQQYHRQQQFQQISQAVSLNDAIALTRSGLSPNLIVSQIRNNGVTQRIGVQEIILLHDNGVSELVIQEMQNGRIAGTTPVTVVPARTIQRAPTVIVERRPQLIIESYPAYHYGYRHRHPSHSRHHRGIHTYHR